MEIEIPVEYWKEERRKAHSESGNPPEDKNREGCPWQGKNRVASCEDAPFYTLLSPGEKEQCRRAAESFPVLVTPYYSSLIRKNALMGGIARQAFPFPEEEEATFAGDADPLGETKSMPVEGAIRKYRDRIVLLVSHQCAVHCRHCNRRGYVRELPSPDRKVYERMLRFVAAHPEIRDVILSGGDPLMLSNKTLAFLLRELRGISHVEIVRIGTRIPVVLPLRVDEELAGLLGRFSPVWVNTQFNHPDEVTVESAQAVDRLLRAGIPVNNQAVLLKGVNDRSSVLESLSRKLLRIKVRPYYLFQCDSVAGAGHFRVSEERAVELMNELWEKISGLGVPFLVKDTEREGKILLAPRRNSKQPFRSELEAFRCGLS